ncbi:YcbX family protein [Enterobacteriaceae bacterium LUAb1]
MITLSRLFIYPLKSMQGLQLSHAQATPSGLAFDRHFVLTEVDGVCITARQFPAMVLFTPVLTPEGLFIHAPDSSSVLIKLTDFSPDDAPTTVWGVTFNARIAPKMINQWLSQFFPRPVQLRWVGPILQRRVKKAPDVPLGFADSYPFMLVNEASLHDMQQRCPTTIHLEQFRPNLAVTGATAWAEDSWSVVRIGDILFDVAKPCARCVFTTISPARGRKHPDGEPMTTLQRFRSAKDGSGDIDFGIHLIARNSGIIHAGAEIHILSTRSPRLYGSVSASEQQKPVSDNDVLSGEEKTVNIEYQGDIFAGNNQQILLEQLEMQGYRIPYSCRAGICGRCRLTLISGEVRPLKKRAIGDDGTILSCSCIPAGNSQLRLS